MNIQKNVKDYHYLSSFKFILKFEISINDIEISDNIYSNE